jgi:hypothetical protein
MTQAQGNAEKRHSAGLLFIFSAVLRRLRVCSRVRTACTQLLLAVCAALFTSHIVVTRWVGLLACRGRVRLCRKLNFQPPTSILTQPRSCLPGLLVQNNELARAHLSWLNLHNFDRLIQVAAKCAKHSFFLTLYLSRIFCMQDSRHISACERLEERSARVKEKPHGTRPCDLFTRQRHQTFELLFMTRACKWRVLLAAEKLCKMVF